MFEIRKAGARRQGSRHPDWLTHEERGRGLTSTQAIRSHEFTSTTALEHFDRTF